MINYRLQFSKNGVNWKTFEDSGLCCDLQELIEHAVSCSGVGEQLRIVEDKTGQIVWPQNSRTGEHALVAQPG